MKPTVVFDTKVEIIMIFCSIKIHNVLYDMIRSQGDFKADVIDTSAKIVSIRYLISSRVGQLQVTTR